MYQIRYPVNFKSFAEPFRCNEETFNTDEEI